jgi:hypothetical protein
MPRKLPAKAVPEFCAHHALDGHCRACGSDDLSIAVYDHYGTLPKDDGPEAKPGDRTFIAALVICKACGQVLTLGRARLAQAQAAE